jgi:RPA family protein
VSFREPAWRVVARELESSLEEERSASERAASYVISPFGSRMNRVLLAGTLSPAEPIGRDESQPFWRARFTDPTGAVAVTAGSFQPRAMAQLRAATTPRSAIVVGKVHLYRGRDGIANVSVRAESLRTVGEGEERAALADAVRQTLDRLDLLARLEEEPNIAPELLARSGVPAHWISAARESFRRYPKADRTQFRKELQAAVRRVAGIAMATDAPAPPVTVQIHREVPPPPRVAPSASERAEESLVLEFLDQVAEASLDAYADRRELLSRVGSRGLGSDRAEEVLTRLEDEGVVEEPIVGKLRRA